MFCAPVPGMDVRDLKRRGREVLVAAVPLGGAQLGQRRQRQMDRIASAFGVRDVALHALDAQVRRSAIRGGRS